MANLLAKKGIWKGLKGKFAVPFLVRGASNIVAIVQMLAPTTKGSVYVSATPPAPACTYMSLATFKTTSQRNFGRLFAKPMPKGLESISRRSSAEGRLFKTNALDQVPDEVWICPPGVNPTAQ